MGLSNYPDGVTGREREIAGPDHDFEEDATCGNTTEHYMIASQRLAEVYAYLRQFAADIQYEDRANQFGGGTYEVGVVSRYTIRTLLDNALNRLTEMLNEKPVEAECAFEGEVLKEQYKNVIEWVCPWCEHFHEEAYDPY